MRSGEQFVQLAVIEAVGLGHLGIGQLAPVRVHTEGERAVGFRTQAHFTGVFAQHAGTTPKAYRMAHLRFPPGSSHAASTALAGQDD